MMMKWLELWYFLCLPWMSSQRHLIHSRMTHAEDIDRDAVLFPVEQEPEEESDLDQMDECLEHGMIYVEKACHALLTQGPCRSDEWLVIDESSRVSCKVKPCRQQISLTGQEHVLRGSECLPIGSNLTCNPTLLVFAFPDGSGICDCPPDWHWNSKANECEPFYDDRTILNFALSCQDNNTALNSDGRCVQVQLARREKTKDISKMNRFLSPRGADLVRFIRIRLAKQHASE